MDEAILIFTLRTSRRKARLAGEAEALSLLRGLQAKALPGGPLSEEGGRFWIALPANNVTQAQNRLARLGYSCAVDLLAETDAPSEPETPTVRWKRMTYRLTALYREDEDAFRERAPDRREFLLETSAGVRLVRGYRGDSGLLSRRGLPVEDARLLVNLVAVPGETFLDPFAGAGGIAGDAVAAGCLVVSGEIEKALRYGLAQMGARHAVADVRSLPFRDASIAAVATEPPYEPNSAPTLWAALNEIARVLKPGGKAAVYSAAHQANDLRTIAPTLKLTPFLDTPIDRKGTDCVILAWEK